MSSCMTGYRYKQLMGNAKEQLTPEEIKEGWHFCWEMDGLLVQYGEDDCFCGGAVPGDKNEEKDSE